MNGQNIDDIEEEEGESIDPFDSDASNPWIPALNLIFIFYSSILSKLPSFQINHFKKFGMWSGFCFQK